MQTIYTKKVSSTRHTGNIQAKMEHCVQLSSQLEERCKVIEEPVGQSSIKRWRVRKGHYKAE